MVRGADWAGCLAESGSGASGTNIASFSDCHRRYSLHLALAEASVHVSRTEDRSYVGILPNARRGKGTILGACLSILGRCYLLVSLLCRCGSFMVAQRRPAIVGIYDSVVARGVRHFRDTLGVP